MKDGRDEVQLIKKDGGETIHVFFSVSDVTNADTYDFQDDPEEISEIEGAPEESLMNGDITPIRANIVIEKSSGGALGIECVSQDNLLIIENITLTNLLMLPLLTPLKMITSADLSSRVLPSLTLMRAFRLLLRSISPAKVLMPDFLLSSLSSLPTVRTESTLFGSTT